MTVAMMLTIAHHVTMLALVAVLAAETAGLGRVVDRGQVVRLARLDLAYGLLAVAMLGWGLARTVWGVRGWDYYAAHPAFWLKLAAFAAVGLCSAVPTISFFRWSRADALPSPAALVRVRRWIAAEWAFLVAVPVCAAVLAGGG